MPNQHHLEHQVAYNTPHCQLPQPQMLTLIQQLHCLIQWHRDHSNLFYLLHQLHLQWQQVFPTPNSFRLQQLKMHSLHQLQVIQFQFPLKNHKQLQNKQYLLQAQCQLSLLLHRQHCSQRSNHHYHPLPPPPHQHSLCQSIQYSLTQHHNLCLIQFRRHSLTLYLQLNLTKPLHLQLNLTNPLHHLTQLFQHCNQHLHHNPTQFFHHKLT